METFEIEHLEYLSKLSFSDEERESFKSEFEDIINFVNEISEINLPQDLELEKPQKISDLRADEPMPSMSQNEVLKNAPVQKDGCYVTPMVVE